MRYILIISFIFVLSFSINAQDFITSLSYTMSAPTGTTQEFIENESYLGLTFDAKKNVLPWLSVGGSFGWQVLYGAPQSTIDLGDIDVSGQQYRYINSFPIMLNSHIYLGGVECFRPFFGVNAGAYFIWRRFEMGLTILEEKKLQWGVAPEVGFTVPIGDSFLLVSGRYNVAFAPSASDVTADPQATTYVAINIGFAYYEW